MLKPRRCGCQGVRQSHRSREGRRASSMFGSEQSVARGDWEALMRAFVTKSLLDTVLLLAAVGTVQGNRAADQAIPVWTVLDDEMQVRYLLEIVLDALRTVIGAIFDDRLPSLVPVQCGDVAHSRFPREPLQRRCWSGQCKEARRQRRK